MRTKLIWATAILFAANVASQDVESEWSYECVLGNCQKIRLKDKQTAVSLGECRLMCDKYASVWPKPTGGITVGKSLVRLNTNSIDVLVPGDVPIKPLVAEAAKRFKENILSVGPRTPRNPGGKTLEVTFNVSDVKSTDPVYKQDESYTLTVKQSSDGRLLSQISAANFFGARHGLETLSQLIIYDDIRGEYQLPDDVVVSDSPVYPHRGVLLDTSRNYLSIDTIKRTIEGMAASKLNIFHWHITDSQSFPFVSKSLPKFSKLGAYSPDKVYTTEAIDDLVQYARVRGVKVMPEFDAPAHVGEGWQDTGFVTCFDKKPWQSYCVEPPCGQLDPTQDAMYDTLELIYKDMVEQFKPDVFHMGGDEVSEKCWGSDERILKWMSENDYPISQAGYMMLWNKFQKEALNRLNKHTGRKIPVILWTSTLTGEDYLEKYLPNDTYIIQIWTTGDDKQVKLLLDKGYQTILSNYDALYFDCGFASWVNDGNNWCSPYIGWQKVYENSPARIAGDRKHLMLGSEAALWTEQVDDTSVDNRIWPRAAAMAERLWAEPTTTWKDAENRMMVHRQRLVKYKIASDTLQPQWCQQHQNSCPVDGPLNLP